MQTTTFGIANSKQHQHERQHMFCEFAIQFENHYIWNHKLKNNKQVGVSEFAQTTAFGSSEHLLLKIQNKQLLFVLTSV